MGRTRGVGSFGCGGVYMASILVEIVDVPYDVLPKAIGKHVEFTSEAWTKQQQGNCSWEITTLDGAKFSSNYWLRCHFRPLNLQKEKPSMLTSAYTELRAYAKRHQDAIVTVALVLVVDHFFFDGSLRDRLRGILSKMLERVEKMIEG